jgi:hypothetical protein
MAARGDVPLQQRAGSNNAPRPGPFGVSASKYDSRIKKVTGTPFTLVERGLKEGPVALAFALPLVFGYLINNTPAPITVEVYAVDAQGRRLLSTSGPIPAGVVLPLFTSFLAQVNIWILAPGEKMELVITAGNPNAGNGFWWWPNKQEIDSRIDTPRLVLPASDTVVMEPQPGRCMYPASFPFEGTFTCCYLFNYSLTTATTADVTLEAEEGDIVVETALPVPANTATPLLSMFGFGHGFSYPNKLRVALASIPTDGDIVYESSCLILDEPKDI